MSSSIAAATTLGKTRWQLAGGNPEVDPHWREHKAELDAHRPFRGFQYSIVGPSEARLFISVNGKPVFNKNRTFRGYRGTATNVTDIVEALQRAERAEARLHDAVDSISEGFVLFDQHDRLVLCNETYRRMHVESAECIIPGTRFEDILRFALAKGQHPDAKGREEEWLAERLQQHRELTGTVEQQLANGRWLLIAERRMSDGGTPVCASILRRSKQCKRSWTRAESIWRGRRGLLRPAVLSSTFERAISSGLTRPIAFLG